VEGDFVQESERGAKNVGKQGLKEKGGQEEKPAGKGAKTRGGGREHNVRRKGKEKSAWA